MIWNLLRGSVKHIANRLGYEIVQTEWMQDRVFANHLRALFAKFGVECVLDVGANRGQYRKFLRNAVGYDGWIVSFEPLQSNVHILNLSAKNDSRWAIYGFALGSRNTHMDINVMKSDNFSSFLDPDNSMVDQFDKNNVIDHQEHVEIRRLDSVMHELRAQYPMRNVYLKMDTQGFDMEVAEGAGDDLANICALQTELSVRKIYDGMPDYQKVLQTLQHKGFDISGMFPVSSDAALRAIEFDCVMVNGRRLGK